MSDPCPCLAPIIGNRYILRDGTITGTVRRVTLPIIAAYMFTDDQSYGTHEYHMWTGLGRFYEAKDVHPRDIVALYIEEASISKVDPLTGVHLKPGVSFLEPKVEPIRFKVGDRVVCPSIPSDRRQGATFTSEMEEYVSQVHTIKSIDRDGDIRLEGNSYFWFPSWLRLATQAEILASLPSFKVGDKVLVKTEFLDNTGITRSWIENKVLTIGRVLDHFDEGWPVYDMVPGVYWYRHAWLRLATEAELKPRVKRTVYLNIVPGSSDGYSDGWGSRELADEHDMHDTRRRIACIELEIDVPEGYGLGRCGTEAVKVKA